MVHPSRQCDYISTTHGSAAVAAFMGVSEAAVRANFLRVTLLCERFVAVPVGGLTTCDHDRHGQKMTVYNNNGSPRSRVVIIKNLIVHRAEGRCDYPAGHSSGSMPHACRGTASRMLCGWFYARTAQAPGCDTHVLKRSFVCSVELCPA